MGSVDWAHAWITDSVLAICLLVGCNGGASQQVPEPRSSSQTLVKITVSLGETVGQGRVTSQPAGIDCPSSCNMTMPIGSQISLTAVPDTSSNFVRWGGVCDGPESCRFTASTDSTVWATFQAKPLSAEDECDGMVPAETRPRFTVKLSRDTTPFTLCSFGEPDGSGSIPIRTTLYVKTYDYQFQWLLFDPATGLQYGAVDSPLNRFVRLLAQSDGFVGIDSPLGGLSPPTNGTTLLSYDRRGVIQSQAPIANPAGTGFEADPSGGLVSVEVVAGTDGNPAFLWRRFDEKGALQDGPVSLPALDSPSRSTDAWAQPAVSVTGHTLVFYGTGFPARPSSFACQAVWLDGRGQRLTSAFKPLHCVVAGFLPLLDGSLVQITETYPEYDRVLAATWRDSSPTASPPPDFLVHWDKNVFSLVRRRRGYAVGELRPKGLRLNRVLSVFTASGKRCGDYESQAAEWWMTLGRDGTLLTMTGDTDCMFRSYPQLFR